MPRAKKNAKIAALNAITRTLTKRRKSIARSNPELANFAGLVLPAAGAYVGTRVASGAVTGMLAARMPRLAKHAQPLSSVALLALIWYASKKSKTVGKYRDGLLAGAAIAAIQAIVATYVPALAGLFGGNAMLLPAASARVATRPAQSAIVAPGELESLAAEQELANELDLGDPSIPHLPMNDDEDYGNGVFDQN